MKSLSSLGISYYLTQSSSEQPQVEPVASSDIEAQTYSPSTDDQMLLSGYIRAARLLIEKRIPGGRSLVNQTRNLYLDCFPTGGEPIMLPAPPLQSVTSIGYMDENGSTQTYASTEYQVHAPTNKQGFLQPMPGGVYPGTYSDRPDAVRITYVAGYGSTGSDVPESLRTALKQLVAHWFKNRESVHHAQQYETPMAFDALLASEDWGYYG